MCAVPCGGKEICSSLTEERFLAQAGDTGNLTHLRRTEELSTDQAGGAMILRDLEGRVVGISPAGYYSYVKINRVG